MHNFSWPADSYGYPIHGIGQFVSVQSTETTSQPESTSGEVGTSTSLTASKLPTTTAITTTAEISTAPLQEFYMYRAAAEGPGDKYPLGNINTGNIEGVMWYLMNEVVTW